MNICKGVNIRRTPSGVPVLRVLYSADPERDWRWVEQERRKYSSQAAWDREQEIIHDAGGGELLFAKILNRHADKIIIRDPNFQIPPSRSESEASTVERRIPPRLWLSQWTTTVASTA